MSLVQITPFNVGLLSADLSNWFGLARTHPYAGRQESLPMQFYLIRLAGRVALVDAPAYEFPGDDSMLLPEYKGRSAAGLLAEIGIAPEAVTDVIITHPHLDHTLGLARPVDEPLTPVFARARHYLGARDWDSGKMEDVERRPFEVLERAGLLSLVERETDLGDGLTILPAPGETPGHQVLWLKAGDMQAYFVGDLFHHPLEFEDAGSHPIWAEAQTLDASKRMLAERAASSGARIYFTHIRGVCYVEYGPAGGAAPYRFRLEQEK